MNQNNIIDKIKALLSKTTENGCTESEMAAALDKARAMMDAYEVTEADLQLTKAEGAVLRSEPSDSKDPHDIKRGLASSVAKFCDCKVWRNGKSLTFCGLKSDAQFATWLLDSLSEFVKAELVKYLMRCLSFGHQRRTIITGFVMGCTQRISERLNALCRQSAVVASENSRALVVVKDSAIKATMAAAGIVLGTPRRSSRRADASSYTAGRSAGDKASFGRPVSGQAGILRIGR